MTDDWTLGRIVVFTCLRCQSSLGRYPEATRGLRPVCAECARQPPAIHPGWFRQSAPGERRADVAIANGAGWFQKRKAAA